VTVGITKDGRWLLFQGDAGQIADGTWEQSGNVYPCAILPDPSGGGLRVFEGNTWYDIPLDVVFPVLHGRNGEDGRPQGLLMMNEIPYVGCDLISSANCMDKALTHTLLEQAGIKQTDFCAFTEQEYQADPDYYVTLCATTLGFPCFIKPANAGSSVGISKARDIGQLKTAIINAFPYDPKLVVERGIDGREIECAVLGNEQPIASVLGEIVPANEFYDYDAKYIGDSKLIIDPALDDGLKEDIRGLAIKAFQKMGCQGMARVDFFVENGTNTIYLNEINTIPGFTSISMYPKLFEASGIPYPALLERLIELAMTR